MTNKVMNGFILFLLIASSILYSRGNNSNPIPKNSRQMILVIANSKDSSSAILLKYERENSEVMWKEVGGKIDVIIGKRGLAWGNGLHEIIGSVNRKKEGDYRSPEGVFTLTRVFGFSKKSELKNLKMPYIHVSKLLECVDDKNSEYYNNLVERNKIDTVDWNSSEKMAKLKTWYEFGVIVDHNINPIKKGDGSCIFLHYWKDENDITSGCTAMEPEEMRKIIFWLDSTSKPILVQLSKEDYVKYKDEWKLP